MGNLGKTGVNCFELTQPDGVPEFLVTFAMCSKRI